MMCLEDNMETTCNGLGLPEAGAIQCAQTCDSGSSGNSGDPVACSTSQPCESGFCNMDGGDSGTCEGCPQASETVSARYFLSQFTFR